MLSHGDTKIVCFIWFCHSVWGQEVCRLKAEGFVSVLGVSDRSSFFSRGKAFFLLPQIPK